MRALVAEARAPLVLDADGLNALTGDFTAFDARRTLGAPAVLTPHEGEYERLMGRPVGDDRIEAACTLAERSGAVVLLKGPGTVVAAPGGRVALNPTGGAALATAGSGDVLTGIVAGFLARGIGALRGGGGGGVGARGHRRSVGGERRPRPRRRRPRPGPAAYAAGPWEWPQLSAGSEADASRRRPRCGARSTSTRSAPTSRALRELAAPAELLAVVKANGYGHGAVPVARAALDAGATWLGVARVEEGEQLRDAGIDAPVMLLSEPAPTRSPIGSSRTA